ncbi:hypothetical protein K9L67_04085 [Candidatus Woesearchaeota archaeon]|nr:hypothetical protein [Candidatus Woesearchaeota archaeon]MCF7901381.1 hypothetical protein [Candidatus Woesearchaeota archaeon]MCF8013148.1 hypothetical protein [Candidatus Woesearchaeota archaeon]
MSKDKRSSSLKEKEDGKVIAIISYVYWLGWLIALIMNQNKKNSFASFHLRQSLLLMIAITIMMWIPFIGDVLSIILFVLWVFGLVYAIQGKEKEIPVIGPLAQDWFKGL